MKRLNKGLRTFKPQQTDSFGRTTLETRPDGTTTVRSYGNCASGCPTGAVQNVTETVSGQGPVTTYFDLLGRAVRAAGIGFDGRSVYQDTEYDALGRVARKSRAYYANETAYWASYTYDLMDRVLTETHPDTGVTQTAYAGYTTTITNPGGQVTTRLVNSQGQLKRVTDALGGVVTYDYDPFGNLVKVTDPAGNITTQTFDLRGRKVGMNDPDLGVWTYTYNALGELLTQTDAKGQVTTNTYDLLGRPATRTAGGNTTTWTYDTVAYGIGKPAAVQAPAGYREDYVYDPLGRVASTSTVFDSVTRTVGTRYDGLSRPSVLTYPSGFSVQQVYNANGYLSEVRDGADTVSSTAAVRHRSIRWCSRLRCGGCIRLDSAGA